MIIKLAGCVMIIAGFTGVAGSWCRDQKQRLLLLKQIRKIYEDLKYYIAYQKVTIPEALLRLSESRELIFAEAFREIYEEQKKGEKEFPHSFREQMEKALSKTPLCRQEKLLLMEFPSCLGFMEEGAQAGALDELLREVVRRIEAQEAEQKNKNKMVMSLGLAGGILLTILLL